MQASLNNYRQSPRKVRLVTDLVKGKTVVSALEQLAFLPKRAAGPIMKLLQSAIANAKQNQGMDPETLVVKDVQVNGGTTMKRTMPRARGSAAMIRKRTSHVSVILAERAPKK